MLRHRFAQSCRNLFKEELTALWTRNNRATDGSTYVLAEYIEVIGTRA